MANCTYTHESLEGVFNSAEDLISALFLTNPLLRGLAKLDFYNNDDGILVDTILRNLATKTKDETKGKFLGITNFVESVEGKDTTRINRGTKTAAIEQIDAYESYGKFVLNYGIRLHDIINLLNRYGKDSKEYADSVKRFKDYMASIQQDPDLLQKWLTNLVQTPSRNTAITFIRNYTPESFDSLIQKTIDSIYKVFQKAHNGNNYKLLTELIINDIELLNGQGMSGSLDAVTYDSDGNVIIWDFKTTNSEILSPATLYSHYKLLAFYKALLAKLGIPVKNISINNIQLTNQVVFGLLETLVKVVNPETFVPFNRKGDILLSLQRIFPKKVPKLAVTEKKAIEEKLEIMTSTLSTPLMRSKIAYNQLVEYLKSTILNNRSVMLYLLQNDKGYVGEIVSYWNKLPDGTYIGYSENNKKLILGTIEEIAEKESKALLELLEGKTATIATILKDKNRTGLKNLFAFNVDRLTAILQALEPYLSPEYEYISISDLESEHNIITMYNHATGAYAFIVVNDLLNLNYFRDPTANILSTVFKNPLLLKEFKEFRELPPSSTENVLTLQALMTINLYKSIISDNKLKIERILVVSAGSGTHTLGCNMSGFETCLKLLEYDANKHASEMNNASVFSKVYLDFTNNMEFVNREQVLRSIVANRISSFKYNNPDLGNDTFSSVAMDMTYDNIVHTLNSIKSEFSTEYLNVHSEIGRIYKDLQLLKQAISSGEVYNELYKHTRKGLSIAETLGAGIDLFKLGESRRYSFNGMMISGIALGLDTSSSYSNPDELVASYDRAFSRATQLITDELTLLAVPLNLATKRFLEAAGKLGIQATVIGNTNSEYEKLFEKNQNGKISDSMLLVNPYKSNDLASYQNEYIEEVLWVFNRLRMTDRTLDSKYRKMTYKEFQKTEAFKDYKKEVTLSSQWRQAPLMLKKGAQGTVAGIANLFRFEDDDLTIRQRVKKFCHNIGDRWLQNIEPLLLAPEQRTEMDKNIDVAREHFEYHSPYNVQGLRRVEITSNHTANEWECNLNILALEYACALFKEKYFLELLDSVGDLMGIIDLLLVMTGLDLTKTREALINRVKISVYNTSLIDEEDRGIALATSGIKRLVSYTKIAVRPALFVKEMVLGVIRNVSAIWAKNIINDTPITYLHLMEAMGIVYTNGLFSENAGKFKGETFGDFRLINLLNNLYRINDRDLNVLGTSISYDHSGIMRIGSRMLYLNTTSPDWFNRMMLLIAKMKADGTWEAHTVGEDGSLLYDMYKDKRYAPFLKWLKSHKGEKEPETEEYLMAKALYKLRIEEFKKEGYSDLTANDVDGYSPLPRCYTVLEMDSFKELVGLMYGYYTHEERATVQKGISWLLHTLFLTFLPAEIKKYLASGNYDSCVGKVIHLVDPISKKKLYWHTNEAGFTEAVTEDKLDKNEVKLPVVEFVKTPLEGLLVSTIKTFVQMKNGTFSRDATPEQWDRTKLFLFNFLISLILGGLLALLSSLGIDAKKSNEATATTLAALDLTKRVASEMNGIGNILSPIANYGIAGTSAIQLAANSAMSLVTSDSYSLLDALNSNFSIVKDFHFSLE